MSEQETNSSELITAADHHLNNNNNHEEEEDELIESEHTNHDVDHQVEEEVDIGLNDHNQFDDDESNTQQTNHNNLIFKSDETESSSHEEILVGADETGLYDDVMAEPAPNLSFSNETTTTPTSSSTTNTIAQATNQETENQKPTITTPSNTTSSAITNTINSTTNSKTYTKRVSCYVGNLTWWTTDKDLSESIQQLGVHDLLEVKFYENKINGQSKGFAMVTVGSDQSFRTLMDKLPKKQLHGQEPLVTHYSRHYFNQFEEQARKDMPSSNSNNSNGNNSNQDQFGHHPNGNLNNTQTNLNHTPPNNMQNRLRNNSFPASTATSTSNHLNNLPPGTMSLNNTRLNNTTRPSLAHQASQQSQQTSLVGNYPNQIRMPSAGNTPSMLGANPQLNRQFSNTNGSNMYNNQQQHQQQRPLLSQQPQTSLLGNRPPLIPNQPLLRPNMPQTPVNQMGLLNNPPRMPLNQTSMLQQRQDWQNNLPLNQQQQQPPQQQQSNGMMPGNPQLMLLNQPRLAQPMQSIGAPGMPPTNGQPSFNQYNQNQNGLLSNQSFHQTQPPQQQQQTLPQQNQYNQMMHSNFSNPPVNHQLLNQNHLQMQSHPMNHGSQTAPPQPTNAALLPHHHQVAPHPPNMSSEIHHLNPHIHDSYAYQPNQHQQARTNSGNSLLDAQLMPQMHQSVTSSSVSSSSNQIKLNEMEFQEALEKNRIVSGSALARAVQDASIGHYPSAIETLQTAISLIKQSKIAHDERCKLLISSLQDTKKGIEDRYYSTSMSNGSSAVLINNHGSSRGDSSSRGESRERERVKRSRSRDSRSRDRDRDRDRDRERSKRSGADKHHRSSHRDRSRDRRINSSGSSIVSSGAASSDYYDEQHSSSSSSRYHHRSRH